MGTHDWRIYDYTIEQVNTKIVDLYLNYGRCGKTEYDSEIISLLKYRKHILNKIINEDIDNYVIDIREFNKHLTEALRDMYDRSKRLYDDIHTLSSEGKGYGEEYEVIARIELDEQPLSLSMSFAFNRYHERLGMTDADLLWELLTEEHRYNERYSNGIGPYELYFRDDVHDSWAEFIGAERIPWNLHLDDEKTKDIPLVMQFHNLYGNTHFAMFDFLYCRKFSSTINLRVDNSYHSE